MAPSGTITRARTARKITRRRRLKKQIVRSKIQEATPNSPSNSSSISSNEFLKMDGVNNFDKAADDDVSTSGCSTPKAQRFRIPEIVTCPPAPKKQRVLVSDCSFQRSPIAFYAPPDLELFFYFALRGISV